MLHLRSRCPFRFVLPLQTLGNLDHRANHLKILRHIIYVILYINIIHPSLQDYQNEWILPIVFALVISATSWSQLNVAEVSLLIGQRVSWSISVLIVKRQLRNLCRSPEIWIWSISCHCSSKYNDKWKTKNWNVFESNVYSNIILQKIEKCMMHAICMQICNAFLMYAKMWCKIEHLV